MVYSVVVGMVRPSSEQVICRARVALDGLLQLSSYPLVGGRVFFCFVLFFIFSCCERVLSRPRRATSCSKCRVSDGALWASSLCRTTALRCSFTFSSGLPPTRFAMYILIPGTSVFFFFGICF